MLVIHVDHSRRFNDTFGHDAGAMVLQESGQVMRQIFREEDMICRYGGEEFVAVVPAPRGSRGRRMSGGTATGPVSSGTPVTLGVDPGARWEQDVTAHQPDEVSIKIGVNDVWRGFAGQPHEAVPPQEYQERLSGLLDRTVQVGARPLLITPFLAEPDRSEPMRQMVERYACLMTALGRERRIPVVELQPAFDAAAAATAPDLWAPDRVHPSNAGHMLIALEFLKKAEEPLLGSPAL